LRPLKLRQVLASVFDEPVAFFLYLFLTGFCVHGRMLGRARHRLSAKMSEEP
jgi:uncharacterized protein (DUF4415 family)